MAGRSAEDPKHTRLEELKTMQQLKVSLYYDL